MLTSIFAINSAGDRMDFPLASLQTGYIVQKIDGLDPVKASFTTTTLAGSSGLYYRSGSRDARNVVLTLELRGDLVGEANGVLRQRLYEIFSPGRKVELGIVNDGVYFGTVYGRTETFNADMFTRRPLATISIMCFDPDIIGDSITTPVMGTHAVTERIINYVGSEPSGWVLTTDPMPDSRTGISVYLNNSDRSSLINFGGALSTGDILKISTVKGDKYIRRVRAGVEASVLSSVSANSTWAMLTPGENRLRVTTPNTWVGYRVQYMPRYGGI